MEEIKIEKYLLSKGIQPQLKGFRYLVEAIKICQKKPEALYGMTTIIYPKIASMYKDSYSKTERAIRHAISTSDKFYTNAKFIGLSLIELKEFCSTKKRGAKNVW